MLHHSYEASHCFLCDSQRITVSLVRRMCSCSSKSGLSHFRIFLRGFPSGHFHHHFSSFLGKSVAGVGGDGPKLPLCLRACEWFHFRQAIPKTYIAYRYYIDRNSVSFLVRFLFLRMVSRNISRPFFFLSPLQRLSLSLSLFTVVSMTTTQHTLMVTLCPLSYDVQR